MSRYQAGESIYELFDKVLVLDQGRQVYFGSPNERQFAPGRSAGDTPSSPEGLENAFLLSPIAHDMQDSLAKYKVHIETDKADQQEFRAAVLSDKKRGVSKKSPYTLGFTGQVRALTIRQFQTRIQDKFQLCTSFGLSTVGAVFTV
jgi:ATP-binding cassette, subfamily G (WHITE), member 2, SNQ2